jgi:5-methylcytosine-specific restriction endonuclease McrA
MAQANALTDRQREYREVYLRSEHWRETRAAALERAEHKCQVCASTKRLDVHHNTYERLGQERPADLVVLCRTCHDRHHSNYNVVTLAPGKRQQPKPKNRPNKKQRKRAAKKPRHRKGDLARELAEMKARNAARDERRGAA